MQYFCEGSVVEIFIYDSPALLEVDLKLVYYSSLRDFSKSVFLKLRQ